MNSRQKKDNIAGEEAWIEEIIQGCRAVRRLRPLVHMIPNNVTAGLCADAIAAVGGRPLMASAPEEMEEITGNADSLVVNLGQPSGEKFAACRTAMETAAARDIPVLFDPVGAGASYYRKTMTDNLTEIGWSGVIKGNQAEIHAVLTGALAHDGVDSLGEYADDEAAWTFLRTMASAGRRLVLASTGRRDHVFYVSDAGAAGRNPGISLLHGKERPIVMVGTGCVAGAVGGALLAAARMEKGRSLTEREMAVCSGAALALAAFAGERPQSGRAAGYGTYQRNFLDRLSAVDESRFREYLGRVLE